MVTMHAGGGDMTDDAALSRVHYELIQGLLGRGICPGTGELALSMGVTEDAVRRLLRGLADIHGVVLHPQTCEPWIVHPFSLTPSLNWVDGGGKGSWWAPCIWCALGIGVLAGGHVRIHTRIGAESQSLVIDVADGEPLRPDDVWVHFAIPPARAWDNVHRHCSLVLPFHSRAQIGDWCARHGTPEGEAAPLRQVAQLARLWYGTHANADWRKWTVAEAQDILARAGLTSEFWRLQPREGKF